MPGAGAVHHIKSQLMHRSKPHPYSITSPVVACSQAGSVLPLVSGKNGTSTKPRT